MPKKTVILEVKEDCAIVMDEFAQVIKIKKKKDMKVGDTIYCLSEDSISSPVRERALPKLPSGGIAAALFAFIIGMSLFSSTFISTSYAAVSIGSEGGVHLELSEDGTIKKVISEEGDDAEYSYLMGKRLSEVHGQLLDIIDSSSERDVFLATAFKDNSRSNQMIEELISSIQKDKKKIGIVYLNGSMKDYRRAVKGNVALSKYLIKKHNIQLWSDGDSDQKTKEEKQFILQSFGLYYENDSPSITEVILEYDRVPETPEQQVPVPAPADSYYEDASDADDSDPDDEEDYDDQDDEDDDED